MTDERSARSVIAAADAPTTVATAAAEGSARSAGAPTSAELARMRAAVTQAESWSLQPPEPRRMVEERGGPNVCTRARSARAARTRVRSRRGRACGGAVGAGGAPDGAVGCRAACGGLAGRRAGRWRGGGGADRRGRRPLGVLAAAWRRWLAPCCGAASIGARYIFARSLLAATAFLSMAVTSP